MKTFERVVVIVTLFLFTLTVGMELGRWAEYEKVFKEGYTEGYAVALEQRQN